MSAVSNEDRLLFADEPLTAGAAPGVERGTQGEAPPWPIAVVDDDHGIHAVTRMVLSDFRYKGRPLRIFDAYSAEEAKVLLRQQPGITVILLDVVMEREHAGLELVKYIREEMDNRLLRIILRTGQPGQAPEGRIITDYDINDYREKQELTSQKLITSVTTALRGYDDLRTIQDLSSSKDILEQMVQKRTVDLVNANRVLQQQRVLLDEAQKIARVGHYEWNPDSGDLVCSAQVYCMLGLETSQALLRRDDLMNLISEEDRQQIHSAIDDAIKGSRGFDFEHSMNRADGTQVRVAHQGEAHLDEQGRMWRVVGILQDVTQQRRADDAMRKLSAAVEQTADTVMITDAKGVIEYVNPAFTRMMGYDRSEILGQTPRMLSSGHMPQAFYQRMWRELNRGVVFSGVVINKRKDGSLLHQALTITPQRDLQGRTTHFISTGRDITEQVRAKERIEHMAHHDSLTGLPNRVLLMDRLGQAIARSKWHDRLVGVLFVDMDRFKVINDTLGHSTGDELLQAMAKRLSACVRDGDTVARLGGDEFAIVLNDVASREDIGQRAQVVVDAVKQPFLIGGRELFVTTSIGICVYPNDGQDGSILLKRADVAMYNAKMRGKSNYQFYTQHDESKELVRLGLETDLRRALDRQEFFVVFQPQVDSKSHAVAGMEALLRWRRQDGKIVGPGEFIPLLEETGMILAVGNWILNEACLAAQNWREAGMVDRRVAVNISIHQFRERGFVSRVCEALAKSGLPPEMLELEITENVLVDDMRQASEVLNALNAVGVRLSIDDFGTGYSSMHYLRHLPFDQIKIDKSFIDGVPHSRDDCAIVTAIITLAHSMELEVTAEGVENVEQYDFVRSLGCELIQGYLFGRPETVQAMQAALDAGTHAGDIRANTQ